MDEYTRKSVSKMIDEFKRINQAKAQQYLTQEQLNDSENGLTVTTYRLPYMTMPQQTLNKVYIVLYLTMVILAVLEIQWLVNSVDIFGATCVPLSLYTIPGYYYSQFNKGYNKKKYLSGLIFAILGVGIMVTYTAMVFFSYANFSFI